MYYVIAPTSNDIQHHGILGMRWGKRNGPPYPLSSGRHSASEKKAGWRKSLDGGGLFSKKKKKQNKNVSVNKEKNIEDDPKYDFITSDERKKLIKEANEKAYDWFKKNDPSQLAEWKKENPESFSQKHDFRKVAEGFEDDLWDKYENEYKDRFRKENYESQKQKVLKTGKASEVLEYKGDLTNDQMQYAVNRIRLENQLEEYKSKETSDTWTKINNAMNRVNTVNNWATIGLNSLGTAEKVYKKLFPEDQQTQNEQQNKQKNN